MKADILTDWFTFTVMDIDNPSEVIANILGLEPDLFQEAPGIVRGYYKALDFGNIYVGYEPYGFAKGVCVTMTGKGCRTYESLGKSFEVLRSKIHINPRINVTRWDIACDDKAGILDMETIIGAIMNRGLRSHCDRRKIDISFDGDEIAGSSLYIGSRRSDYYIRIYDKAKEFYDKNKEPELYNKPWVRVELVLKKKYSENAVDHMENHADLGGFVAQMINGHMAFINRDDSNISRCSLTDWWQNFIESVESVKLWSKGEINHSFDEKVEMVAFRYGPTLAMLFEGLGYMDFMAKIIHDGKKRMSSAQRSLVTDYKRQFSPA